MESVCSPRRISRSVTRVLVFGLVAAVALLGLSGVPRVEAQATGTVSGSVTDSNGNPVAGLRVGIYALDQTLVQTSSNGSYVINNVATSAGPYDVQLLDPCTKDQSKRVVVDGAKVVNFTVPAAADKGAGYQCTVSSFPYINGTTNFGVEGDDAASFGAIPFSFPFCGASYNRVYVNTNGALNFTGAATPFANTALPSDQAPAAAIYPFWDDFTVDDSATVRTATGGVAPNRYFVIEWSNVVFNNDPNSRVSFEAVLSENGQIVFNYKDIDTATAHQAARGLGATVGLVNGRGTAALQRSFNQPYLDNGLALEFTPTPK